MKELSLCSKQVTLFPIPNKLGEFAACNICLEDKFTYMFETNSYLGGLLEVLLVPWGTRRRSQGVPRRV